ncbi:MAG TPA: condensation domain-containing protein, partial [Vicinamibacteria bacterium]
MTTQAGFRLSPPQKRLWQHQGDDVWRTRCLIRIDGELRPGEIRAALAEVVRRNEILRTGFRLFAGAALPLQVIFDGAPLAYDEHDLGGRSTPEQEAWLAEAYDELLRRPIDLAQGPVFHAVLARLGASRQALLLALPSLNADAASLPRLARRVLLASVALRGNQGLPDEPAQYADLAEWAIEQLDGEEARDETARWRERNLADAPALRLPFGRTGANASFRMETVAWTLPEGFLGRLGRIEGDPESFLLAGWQALIRRLTGAAEASVGISVHGRDYEGLEEALGLLERVVPLGLPPQEEVPGLGKLSLNVKDAVRERRERQHLFSWDAAGRDGTAASPPFLHFAFRYVDDPPLPSAEGLSVSIEEMDARVDRFGIQVAIRRTGEGARAELNYDADVYERAEIERLAGFYGALLADALERPDAPFDDLTLLGEAERRRVLDEFNPGGPGFPHDRQVHEVIEEWAKRTPDAPAVACGAGALSYRELHTRAEALARRLRAQG